MSAINQIDVLSSLERIAADLLSQGKRFWAPTTAQGLKGVPIVDQKELSVINNVVRYLQLEADKVDQRLAAYISSPQLQQLITTAVSYFKARLATEKFLGLPPKQGEIGIAPLFPQAIKYTTTTPTGYANNSWEIPVTAGTEAFLFGSPTNFYTASSTADAKSLIVVFPSGIFEFGSTPTIEQWKFLSQEKTAQINVTGIFNDTPLKLNQSIYQYNLPGFYIDDQLGVKISFMPRQTKTAEIRLLGVVVYEYGFLPDLKYVV